MHLYFSELEGVCLFVCVCVLVLFALILLVFRFFSIALPPASHTQLHVPGDSVRRAETAIYHFSRQ